MKKRFLVLPFLAGLLCFSSCSSDDSSSTEERYTIAELEEYNYKHVAIKKIGEQLYEIQNDDYWTNYAYNPYATGEGMNGVREWHGLCGALRNGDLYGRNLDWICSYMPEFIIRTPAKDGRHATLGMHTSGMIKSSPREQWISQMLVNDLTKSCYDGVNDAGVCASVLAVHFADDVEPTGTNPTAKLSLHGSNVVRYVLDNASSASNAVSLLQNVNIYGTLIHFAFHWMICDEKDTYFVEIINNKVVATRVEENPMEEYRAPIITNFYMQKDFDKQLYPEGVERYETLKKAYPNASTVDGMFEALRLTRLSTKYLGKNPSTLAPGEEDVNLYSEYYHILPDYSNPSEITFFDKNTPRQEIWDKSISYDIENNSIYRLREKGIDPRSTGSSEWTMHSVVYNIKERTMQLVTMENYDKVYPSKTTSFSLFAK